MENKGTLQKLSKKEESPLDLAIRYYTILCAVNNLKVTEREIQLIAFTAIKGNMSYSNIREEFIKTYESSSATINNIVSRLKKLGFFYKDGSKIKVNPKILLDFNNPIILNINLQING